MIKNETDLFLAYETAKQDVEALEKMLRIKRKLEKQDVITRVHAVACDESLTELQLRQRLVSMCCPSKQFHSS